MVSMAYEQVMYNYRNETANKKVAVFLMAILQTQAMKKRLILQPLNS